MFTESDRVPGGLPGVLSLNSSLYTLVRAKKISTDAAFAASYDLHGLNELFDKA